MRSERACLVMQANADRKNSSTGLPHAISQPHTLSATALLFWFAAQLADSFTERGPWSMLLFLEKCDEYPPERVASVWATHEVASWVEHKRCNPGKMTNALPQHIKLEHAAAKGQ